MMVDKFEELINELNGMSDDDRNERIKGLEAECVCPICPTFNQCAKDTGENIFCLKNESNCINTEKGCMCPTCPFAATYKIGVVHNFYCKRGGEVKQRKGL